MADSFSSSGCADTEDCRSASNLSLSVGHYPCEDTFSCENTISCEDMSSMGPSVHLVPPIQGTWRTKSIGRLLGRQDQIQDDPEQFCKLSITLAWDIDMGSNHSDSITNWGLRGDNQWTDLDPKEKTQPTLSKLDGLVQKLEKFLQNQKDDEDEESVFPESAQEENFQLPSSSPPDTAQMKSQATGSRRTSTTETSSSVSSDLPEDTHSNTQALSCLNFRWVFRWLRQHVLPSFGGREHPEEVTEYPHRLTQKKRLFHRSKRIQPQESLELGYL
ncbi:hypothetical protein mRhiFer1_001696 [Rhinolophus ferrumequinum]|uniref:Uncharacterized protein n=1 Tax=Rhinolophus ferrumequinum TaxID=59479 RepID=A0A7J7WNE7_RHIFE|nr:hypothetical protein mRhiFer1_001696 [Rhinolophus ferrumequinum]